MAALETEPVRIEELLGGLAFLLTIIGSLTDMSFAWRFGFAIAFVVLFAHWCLITNRLTGRAATPVCRLILSVLLPCVFISALWNPFRKKYMQEHLPPSFAFIIGAPLGENNSAYWLMFAEHYGPSIVNDDHLFFNDLTRQSKIAEWQTAHPHTLLPQEMVDESRYQVDIDQMNPYSIAKNFKWTPVNPDYQHYEIDITSPYGEFIEDWKVERTNGSLLTRLIMSRLDHKSQVRHQVFACTDQGFAFTDKPPTNGDSIDINPFFGWQGRHFYGFPVVVTSVGNWYIATPHSGCWLLLTKHYGDAILPLTLPTKDRFWIIALIIYGGATFIFTYCEVALLLMWKKQQSRRARGNRRCGCCGRLE